MPVRRTTPSSRYAAAKRAKTEQVKPEAPASQRVTAKDLPPQPAPVKAAAPAPAPTPAAPAKAPSSARIAAQAPRAPAPAQPQAQKAPSTARVAAQPQPKAPSSARVPAQPQRAPSSARNPTQTPAKAPSSARLAKSGSAARAGAPAAKQAPGSSRRLVAKAKGGKMLMIIAAALVVVVLIVALGYKPLTEGFKIKAMDAAKSDPAKLDAALQASDEFVKMVDGDPVRIKEVVVANHGPVEVQIHLAQAASLLPQLVSIAERESDTPAQRAAALVAATAVYDRDKHAKERLPNALADWCADPKQPDEVAAAALALVARAGRDEAPATLAKAAGSPELTGARVAAALDGLAQLVDPANVGQALALFVGPTRDRPLGHAGLKDAIAKNSSSQVDKLIELAFSDDRNVRVFALSCLGDHGSLPDLPANDSRRLSIAARFAPVIRKGTDPDELAGAIKAAKRLALTPTVDQLLDLTPELNVLQLPGIDAGLLSECMGKDFIITGSDGAKAQADLVVKKLTAALADSHRRAVAAGALKLVSKPDLPSVRPALDQLAAIGDPDCVAALKSLVGQAYGRADIVKINGDRSETWKTWLASEHEQGARLAEITKWLDENGKFLRVSDGRERLQTSADYLAKAKADLKPWAEPTWAPPLGVTKEAVAELSKKVKFVCGEVDKSLAGAKQ